MPILCLQFMSFFFVCGLQYSPPILHKQVNHWPAATWQEESSALSAPLDIVQDLLKKRPCLLDRWWFQPLSKGTIVWELAILLVTFLCFLKWSFQGLFVTSRGHYWDGSLLQNSRSQTLENMLSKTMKASLNSIAHSNSFLRPTSIQTPPNTSWKGDWIYKDWIHKEVKPSQMHMFLDFLFPNTQ